MPSEKNRAAGKTGRCIHINWRSWCWKNCIYAGNCGGSWYQGTNLQPDIYHRTGLRGRAYAVLSFDVYRIGNIEEMDEIGYEDYFYGNGLCMIEWANLIEEILPEKRHDISIEKDLEKGFDYRKIIIRELD